MLIYFTSTLIVLTLIRGFRPLVTTIRPRYYVEGVIPTVTQAMHMDRVPTWEEFLLSLRSTERRLMNIEHLIPLTTRGTVIMPKCNYRGCKNRQAHSSDWYCHTHEMVEQRLEREWDAAQWDHAEALASV